MTEKINPLDIVSKEDREKLEMQFNELENELNHRKNELAKIIKEYPLTSVIIAAGIGYIIGKMFNNNR